MDLKWYTGRSEVEPVLVDEEASDKVTIVRKDVHQVEVDNMDGSKSTLYEYSEAMPTKSEYALYLLSLENMEAHTQIELAVAEAVEALLG